MKPEFLLAFSIAKDLDSLTKERAWIDEKIRSRGGSVHRPDGDLSLAHLETVFEGGAKNLVAFHYGGHAGDKGLYNKKANGEEYLVMSFEDLAEKLSAFENLRMVFINGCNSQAAADWFFEKSKAEVLICTQKRVNDKIALDFAVSFYPKLLSNNDLGTAFEGAKKLKSNATGGMRGVEDADNEDGISTEFVIKYRENNVELGKATFQQWIDLVGNNTNNLSQPKEVPQTIKPLGVQPNAYLLCNRHSTLRTMTRKINRKIDDDQIDPLFVFIHEEEAHCPTDFFQRLSTFSFNSILENKGFSHKKTPLSIELPFDAIEDGNVNKAQLKLFEDYCRQTNWGKQAENGQWQLATLTPDNDFWVIHHDLKNAEWFEEWGEFWTHYVHVLAKELAQKLSKRLIIVTTCIIRTRNKGFATHFEKLATDNASFVLNLNQFEKIIYDDISEWQVEVFKETKFKSETLIPKENTEGVFFLDIKEKLREFLK